MPWGWELFFHYIATESGGVEPGNFISQARANTLPRFLYIFLMHFLELVRIFHEMTLNKLILVPALPARSVKFLPPTKSNELIFKWFKPFCEKLEFSYNVSYVESRGRFPIMVCICIA